MGVKLEKGHNDLRTWCELNGRMDFLLEWHYEKNRSLKNRAGEDISTPDKICSGSGQLVWWKCEKGHEWQAAVTSRTGKAHSGCPYCANKKTLGGFNDLMTTNPELCTEWDYEKNSDLTPCDVTAGSGKKVWWKCNNGHEWEESVALRTGRNSKCPYCGNRRLLTGYNDLQTKYPDIAAQWHPTKNDGLTPDIVMCGVAKKVWWRCENGHEWQALVSSRTGKMRTGCPYCANKKAFRGFNDLMSTNPELCTEWNYEKNGDLIPCDVTAGSGKKVWWKCSKGHEWEDSVVRRSGRNSKCPYCGNKRLLTGYNDLQTKYPDIAAEWHPTKNGDLTPNKVLSGVAKRVWWRCKFGHEWETTINSRTTNKSGCPYCAGQKIMPGVNDLATLYPDVLKEWNYEKNIIAPNEIMAHTRKKVWWKCPSGHDYLMTTASKTRGRGCPTCAMATHTSFPEQAVFFYVKKAYPDTINAFREYVVELDVFIPSINTAIEYDGYRAHKHKYKKDLEKNKLCVKNGIRLIRLREDLLTDLDDGLSTVIPLKQSNIKALEEAIIKLFKILEVSVDVDLLRDEVSIKELYDNFKKERSIADVAPELIKEWHPTKNGKITPNNVYANSNHKYWWKCSNGHEWQTTALKRVSAHRGCPYCTNQRVLKGYNDLASQFPEVAKQWSPNNAVMPDEVIAKSAKEYLWIGDCGHEWKASITNRRKGCGCPYCANQKVLTGFNDLQTLNPELTQEWNYEKNGSLMPTDVVAGSTKKVWWRCMKCGSEWQSAPYSRSRLCCRSCNQKDAGLKRRKRIINIDTGEIYDSVSDVEMKTGISVQCIGLCCRGKLKTAGGYHWKYVEG